MSEETEQLILGGFHGTTGRAASSILKSGFNSSRTGLRGFGVYFWSTKNGMSIAEDLAEAWILQRRLDEKVADYDKGTSAILKAEVRIKSESCLDITEGELKKTFNEIFARVCEKEAGQLPISDEKKYFIVALNKLFELLEIDPSSIATIIAFVRPPAARHCKKYRQVAMGYPSTMVVREASYISGIEKVRYL